MHSHRTAGIQAFVLLALGVILFLPVLRLMYGTARWNPEAAHALAAPVLLLLLVYFRRDWIAAGLRRGSIWGVVLLLLAIGIYFLAKWPFNYALVRRTAIAPAAAGIVLAVGGWRVLWRCLPMFLLLLIALPTGTRYYAALVVRPETLTLQAVRATLDLLPGVMVDLTGLDLTYTQGSTKGSIALGVSYRGASLLPSYLSIAVFITFIRIRPWWQVVMMAVASVPLILFCNYARLLVWGLVTIYGDFGPLSTTPRVLATVLSIVLAYLLSILLLGIAQRILVAPPAPAEDGHASSS
jgi:hypothetical protein